jgi:hypothetical protein
VAGGTLLPFTLFAFAQSRVAAEVAGAFFNIEPLVGAVAGVVVFGNPAGPAQLIGGAAILAGIALSSLPLIGAGRARAERLPQQETRREPARTSSRLASQAVLHVPRTRRAPLSRHRSRPHTGALRRPASPRYRLVPGRRPRERRQLRRRADPPGGPARVR